jgi:hypothetical protein
MKQLAKHVSLAVAVVELALLNLIFATLVSDNHLIE